MGKTDAQQRLRHAYGEMFGELRIWGWKLRTVAMFNFFIAFAGTAVRFFLPIGSFVQNGNLTEAILIGILLTVPTLFGWALGKLFDRRGTSLFLYGFLSFGILLGSLALSSSPALKLCVAFGVGIILELLSVGSNELITIFAEPKHFGRVGGIMRTIFDTGSMTGPLLVGILLDWGGMSISYSLLAALMFVLAGVFSIMQANGFALPLPVTERYHHRIHQRK